MSDDPAARTLTYVATGDPVVCRRVWTRAKRAKAGSWVGFYIQFALPAAVIGALSYSVGSTVNGGTYNTDRTMVGGVFGLIGGLIWALAFSEAQTKAALKRVPSTKLECQITDEAFVSRKDDGIAVSIPWAVMKIEVEDPDAWLIAYAEHSLIVFRKPLREAGLEEEFLRRLTAQSHRVFG